MTKVLDEKSLSFSVSFSQKQILYLYNIPPCKHTYNKEVILNLKVSYVYCKSLLQLYTFD